MSTQILSYLSMHDDDVDAAFAAVRSDMVRSLCNYLMPLMFCLPPTSYTYMVEHTIFTTRVQEWELEQRIVRSAKSEKSSSYL